MPLFNSPAVINPQKYGINIISSLDTMTGTTSGTGASNLSTTRAGFFEIRSMNTGTTTSGSAGIRQDRILAGNGEIWSNYLCEIVDLATVSEDYIFEIGIHDGTATAAIDDGMYFRYDRSTNTNWLAISEDTGTVTSTDTGIAVAEDTVINLGIYINNDQTSVEYFIDEALVATHTTNLNTTNNTEHNFLITKTAGTTSRRVFALYAQSIVKRS